MVQVEFSFSFDPFIPVSVSMIVLFRAYVKQEYKKRLQKSIEKLKFYILYTN